MIEELNKTGVVLEPELDFKFDRPTLITTNDFFEAASRSYRLADVVQQRIMQETEDVEESRLTRAIRPDEHTHRK